jgi:hypothetical protein
VDILSSSKCTRTKILDNYTLIAQFRQLSTYIYTFILRSFLRFFAKKSIFCSKQSLSKNTLYKYSWNVRANQSVRHFDYGRNAWGLVCVVAKSTSLHPADAGYPLRSLAPPFPNQSSLHFGLVFVLTDCTSLRPPGVGHPFRSVVRPLRTTTTALGRVPVYRRLNLLYSPHISLVKVGALWQVRRLPTPVIASKAWQSTSSRIPAFVKMPNPLICPEVK